MSENWSISELGSLFELRNEKKKQIRATEYLKTGDMPVVDQSDQHIAGYIDDLSRSYGGRLPVIVFGDHTRVTKFIDFSFGAGADGTQIFEPRADIDAKFLYYLVKQAAGLIGNYGYDRHLKHLRRFQVFFSSSLREQRRIAEMLSTLDETIEQTEALIAKYQQIKTGLVHDLFTRGVTPDGKLRPTRAEAPQLYKESPLGWIPKEWEIYPLSAIAQSLIDGPFGSNLKTEHYVLEPGVRVVRLQNIQEGFYNDNNDRAFVSSRHADDLSRNEVTSGDILIAALGEDKYPPGRACCYPEGLPSAINKADCYRLRCETEFVLNAYVMHFLNTGAARIQVRRFEQGVTRRRTNLGNFRRVMVAVPTIEEQERIVELLAIASGQIESAKTVVQKLGLQKHGLMHDLLTGRVRVKVAESAAA